MIGKIFEFNLQYNSIYYYIINPLLIRDRKFHIRLHWCININDNGIHGYLFKDGYIFLAKNPYKRMNYSNKEIHDTHYISEEYMVIFPDGFKKIFGAIKTKKVQNGIIEILASVLKKVSKKMKCYSETKYCYYVLGVDIMILDDFTPILIEINYKQGLKSIKQKEYVNNLLNIVLGFDLPTNYIET